MKQPVGDVRVWCHEHDRDVLVAAFFEHEGLWAWAWSLALPQGGDTTASKPPASVKTSVKAQQARELRDGRFKLHCPKCQVGLTLTAESLRRLCEGVRHAGRHDVPLRAVIASLT